MHNNANTSSDFIITLISNATGVRMSKQLANITQVRRATYGSRENNVNILRFVAASTVIYYHMAVFLGYGEIMVLGRPLGYVAVDIFFILSGYLIASSWTHSTSFASYLVRRVARIFPALIVVVLVTTFVIGPAFTTLSVSEYFSNPGTWKYLSLIVLAPIDNVLPGVFVDNPYPAAVNGSLWTLRYEFLMYLVLPLAYRLLGGARGVRKPVAMALLVILIVMHWLTTGGVVMAPAVVVNGSRLAAYFFIGVVVYEFGLIGRFNVQYSVLALLLMVIFHDEAGPLCPLVMLVLVTVFTTGFCFVPDPKFARCFSKNDFSYGIYIWAFPIQQALVQLGAGVLPDSVLLYTAISFAITVAVSVASWFAVERPAMQLGRRLSKRF